MTFVYPLTILFVCSPPTHDQSFPTAKPTDVGVNVAAPGSPEGPRRPGQFWMPWAIVKDGKLIAEWTFEQARRPDRGDVGDQVDRQPRDRPPDRPEKISRSTSPSPTSTPSGPRSEAERSRPRTSSTTPAGSRTTRSPARSTPARTSSSSPCSRAVSDDRVPNSPTTTRPSTSSPGSSSRPRASRMDIYIGEEIFGPLGITDVTMVHWTGRATRTAWRASRSGPSTSPGSAR